MSTEALTSYVILVAPEGEEGFYVQPNPVSARTGEEAIRKLLDILDAGTVTGTLAAVPTRSWRPYRVRTETHTVTKLEAPTQVEEEETADVDA